MFERMQRIVWASNWICTDWHLEKRKNAFYQIRLSLIYPMTDLSIYLSIYLSIPVFSYLSIYPSIPVFSYLSIYLSISMFSYRSIYRSIYPSVFISIYLSQCFHIYLSIPVFSYLSIYLKDFISISIYFHLSIDRHGRFYKLTTVLYQRNKMIKFR